MTATQSGIPDPVLPPVAPLHPGDPRRLGAYQLLGRLGEGGMGTVFLARAGDGQPVAVKVIRSEYSRDQRFRARFRKEAEAARQVARFCTAQVLAAGAEGDLAYLVTEYIDGPTLAAAVAREGPLRGSMLDSLAIGVAAALGGIHAAGVVHRDLKPSNVLLSRVGPKVIDFGIARALAGLDELTQSGQLVGTPAYMAPEQFRGDVTTATDVFAWGAVVAFAGSGRPPFGAGPPYELMARVATAEPDLAGLDQRLHGLVTQAMAKDPARRPSARTLLLALVGEVDDPLDAGTRIVQSAWTPPPVHEATTLRPAGPTRVDRPARQPAPGRRRQHAAARSTTPPDPPARRPARWRRRLLAGAAVVALGATGALLLASDWLPALGDDAGSPGTPSPSGVDDDAPGGGPSPGGREDGGTGDQDGDGAGDQDGDGSPETVALGERVPAEGFTALGVGEIHRYQFRTTAAQELYVEVRTQSCAHLLPWVVTDQAGGTIANGTLGCGTDGPYSLAAGAYELQVGDGNVDGAYAFRLTSG